ncbi:uncharacterized protein LY89DRAFT_375673 [Mollisia scopiformis]|uniref:Uncharacterized protein n=1 Tax=Mollisia scopiformis TaxID=149040 RepID=A0A132B3Q4_MOLSC|nr:uncharacterized protein LY89DRAFT_375673 [Mollisia scopiformis]KUJ07038.1 hypothetical protein LY89DRAFT_375673 [Mollisia scopiformis]
MSLHFDMSGRPFRRPLRHNFLIFHPPLVGSCIVVHLTSVGGRAGIRSQKRVCEHSPHCATLKLTPDISSGSYASSSPMRRGGLAACSVSEVDMSAGEYDSSQRESNH